MQRTRLFPASLLLALLAPASAQEEPAPSQLPVTWSRALGEGFSGVIADDEQAYASFREPGSERLSIGAFGLDDGAPRWTASLLDAAREGQENYGGGRGPHATPTVHEGRLFVLGYSGVLAAFDTRDGERLWQVDLVDERGATPVQFGFAASAVGFEDTILVHSGGASGFAAFAVADGRQIWKSTPAEPSYVTPILLALEGQTQLVGLTRDALQGLDPSTGEVLWSLPQRKPGMTNYAMLRALPEGGVLVSGQGTAGLQCVDIERTDSGWQASVRWHTRSAQFSHGRVILEDGFVYGSTGQVLCAVATADGSLGFKQRELGPEANWIPAGPWNLRLDEEGTLEVLRVRPERIEVWLRQTVLESKAWAPPLVTRSGLLLLRDAHQLVALRLPPEEQWPEAPLEEVETGYSAGVVNVPRALLAMAQGHYRDPAGRELWLERRGTELYLRLAKESEFGKLTAENDQRFLWTETATRGALDLELTDFEGTLPGAVQVSGQGGAWRAERQATAAIELTEEQAEGLLGAWVIAEGVELELALDEKSWVASSSQYPGVKFAVRVESQNRLWLSAVDAPYGIPAILLDFSEEDAWVHQGSESYRLERP